MEQPDHLPPTEQQCESSTKRLLKFCLVGDNETGKTTRVEKFLQAIGAETVLYASDYIALLNDRETFFRFLIQHYLPTIPTYLFIKRGEIEVLRYLKRRLVGQEMDAEFIFSVLDRFPEEREKLQRDQREAQLVLSLFDGVVPPERSVLELRGDFLKSARVALLLEGIKTYGAMGKSGPQGAFVGVLRTLGTREGLLTLSGKEDAWDVLQEAVENSAFFTLRREAQQQATEAKKKLQLNKTSERHFRKVLKSLLKQRVGEDLWSLKPKMTSAKSVSETCRFLGHLPSLDALVVDGVPWGPRGLSLFLKYMADAPCSVLVTSTVSPMKSEGSWLLAATR